MKTETVRSGHITDIDEFGQLVVRYSNSGASDTLLASKYPSLRELWSSAGATLIGRAVNIVIHTMDNDEYPVAVLEPEITIDVTEAAGYLGEQGPNVDLIGVRRLQAPAEPSVAIIRGSAINAALDALVRRPSADDEVLVAEAIRSRPLAMAALANRGNQHIQVIESVHQCMPRLRDMVESWKGADVVLEPFLVSPTYGLQGRADIVLRREDSIEILELKSGTPPKRQRRDHAAQAACYTALLMQAENVQSLVHAKLWYVQDIERPLHDVHDVQSQLRSVLEARNAVVLNELCLSQRNMRSIQIAVAGPIGNRGPSSYEIQHWHTLSGLLRGLGKTERHIIAEWIRMSANEFLAARLGGGSARSAADIWRLSPEQRRVAPSVLVDLTIDFDQSNLEAMHVVFRRPSASAPCSIRVADAVVLRRTGASHPETSAHSIVLYKGSVKAIDQHSITVSLRNKYADIDERSPSGWSVEQDVMDSGVRSMSTSIRMLIEQPQRRRDVVLGLAAPNHGQPRSVNAPMLTDVQRTIVARAVAAHELFLIQGPPGSGKTSAVLRAIVQELLIDEGECILCVAFTNRAANEICSVLHKHGVAHLRHGSADGATGESSIPRLARELEPNELATAVTTARVIVATVASLHASSEIWTLAKFSTVIVDEASQIIEAHLVGIIANCQRSILIGDHCQLPAVIAQPPAELVVQNEHLRDIGMTNLGVSGFERLVRCALSRGDHQTVAMLTQQGRMHEQIMQFPSDAFYGGRLTCLRQEQRTAQPPAWAQVLPDRTCFIDVDTQTPLVSEAETLCDIACSILADQANAPMLPTIGIITPFRMQNNAISHMLDARLDVRLRHCILVDTVERFQGSECDVILYGTAVTTLQEFDTIRSEVDIDGHTVDRKLNVAITRAKEQFVLVGNARILVESAVYRQFLLYLRQRQWPS